MTTKIAYIMSRFPKLTETFVLYEMIELQQMGAQIEVFPLLRHQDSINHPEADDFVHRAHYTRLTELAVWGSQVFWLWQNPLVYLAMWWAVLWGNKSSLKFFLRAIPAALLGAHFARQMLSLGVTHIHAHWASHATLAAFAAHRLTGIPYSFTGHAHDIYVETAMLAQKIQEAAFAVTISDHNRAMLTARYGPDLGRKIGVVRCGVDTSVFTPAPIPTPNPGDTSALNLIAIGRYEEKKGHQYLIEACQLLTERGIEYNCAIVGSGPLQNRLQAQIDAAGINDYVKLTGPKTRREVQQLLASADVMVMPSVRLDNGKQEGIPVALMEGLAMQKAAVATAISGIPELIIDGETGLLAPERSPRALADAVAKLAEDPALRTKLGQNGRLHVRRHFDLHQNAQDLYRRIQAVQQQGEPAPI